MSYPFGTLPENLAAFCARLRREYRFRIGPRELQDAARALEVIDVGSERAVRDALRPVLSGRLEDVKVFDRAFDEFFHGRSGAPAASVAEAAPDSQSLRPGADDAIEIARPEQEGGSSALESVDRRVNEVSEGDHDAPAEVLRASYSPLDAEGAAPDLEPADPAWRAAAAVLASSVHARLSRRWRPARHGQRFDFRRTLRGSLHTGGDAVTPRWRARRRRPPRFVVLVDGSRSMGALAEPALQLAVALTTVAPDTETFTFSTALRRVTRDVRRAAAGERRPLHLHQGWGGGTAIGACVRELLHRFGARAIGRNTIVIVASDGLDVGDADLLRHAMAALARLSAAIVWLNPLAAAPAYEPAALAMRLARPFVAVLSAANEPGGVEKVARALRVR